jgi:hypothetical protein
MNCWEGQPCHKCRTYYRNRDRYNRNKRQKYAVGTGKVVPVVAVSAPEKPAAIRQMYRAREDTPLHAMGAELWLGQKQVAIVEPVHTLGWTGSDVKQYSRDILRSFSEHLEGAMLERYETQIEIDPNQCPIRPCPLCS